MRWQQDSSKAKPPGQAERGARDPVGLHLALELGVIERREPGSLLRDQPAIANADGKLSMIKKAIRKSCKDG